MNPDSAADSAAAKRRAIKLLAARDRTAHELHTRLSRDYEPSVVEEVLAYLEDRGYIDDGRFARNYVDQRNRFRPTGNLGLSHELAAKGVPSAIIETVLNSPEEELDLAKRLLSQRAPTWQGLPGERRLRRAYGLLERRGFPWQTARAAVTQVLDSDLQKD
ncbi:MAG TPA: regulatory protein RecX [Firmicutes bacterium]|jgi:regulatory protein|nr:regulatory protein RecX [Bacillota bacterium]